MKIIDKATGKRLKEVDPLKANPLKDEADIANESSPMDPPDAYAESTVDGNKSEKLDESLTVLVTEHKVAMVTISKFEKALIAFKENSYQLNNDINEGFKVFFEFFDDELLPHNRKEEKTLFPILHQKLIENGEHSPGDELITAIDMMEDDHIKFIQLGTLTFNLLGLAPRFRDEQARIFTYDVAYNNGLELVELLKLHIFREDTTLFPLAQKFISKAEFNKISMEMKKMTPKEHEHSENCTH